MPMESQARPPVSSRDGPLGATRLSPLAPSMARRLRRGTGVTPDENAHRRLETGLRDRLAEALRVDAGELDRLPARTLRALARQLHDSAGETQRALYSLAERDRSMDGRARTLLAAL